MRRLAKGTRRRPKAGRNMFTGGMDSNPYLYDFSRMHFEPLVSELTAGGGLIHD